MQTTLIKTNEDKQLLVDDLFPLFKEHLRILHDIEDNTIRLYLEAAIEAIATYSGRDLFPTEYSVFYPDGNYDYSTPSDLYGWYCGKSFIRDIDVFNAAGVNILSGYTLDAEKGMVYPHPLGNKIVIYTGYNVGDEVPANLKNIIFRAAASFFENREDTRVGEPKLLPSWITHALASIWVGRV